MKFIMFYVLAAPVDFLGLFNVAVEDMRVSSRINCIRNYQKMETKLVLGS